jgi:hypothetical protein
MQELSGKDMEAMLSSMRAGPACRGMVKQLAVLWCNVVCYDVLSYRVNARSMVVGMVESARCEA